MTEDFRTGGPGQQQFLVQQGDKLYVTQVIKEADPQDERYHAVISGGSEAGTAFAYSGDEGGVEYKSMQTKLTHTEAASDSAHTDSPI